jgi:hypothetical protein
VTLQTSRNPSPVQGAEVKRATKGSHLDDSTDAAEDDDDADISQEEAEGTDMDWDTKTLVDDESDADSMAAMELEEPPPVPTLYCAFCRWADEEAGPRKREREYSFSRVDTLGRHIRVQHLRPRAAGEGFVCPYEGCSAFLGSAMHFLNHTERQHELRLWYHHLQIT